MATSLKTKIPKRGDDGGQGPDGLSGPTGPAGIADFPTGTICMWHGLLANIPSGWALCDGTGGTPDLRDKFLRGAAAAANPGTTGGSATHTHDDHASQSHSGLAVSDHAALSHSGAAIADWHDAYDFSWSGTVYGTLQGAAHSVTQANNHGTRSHSITQPSAHAAESHPATNYEPAYYTVAFVRKT
jgi:hypothetical protein